ncbi:phosphoglucosamine mutase [Haloferacaceae archaeon DSL9]
MFGTSGVRGPVGEEVTATLAVSIGRAVATAGADRVVVGRDARESGEFLAAAAAAGVREAGADVIDLGLASTPAVARSVAWRDADAGIMITASHNPPEDNGIKLWTPSGQAFDADRRAEIESIIAEDGYSLAAWDESGGEETWGGAVDRHAEALADAVDVARPLEVVVDVGNGVGQVTARALAELGCSVTTLNGQPDGAFPGRPSEPTEETLEALCAHMEATGADLGVAHDGDADRMVAVDETGTFVPKDVLLALFARGEVAEGTTVAAPVDTSLCVDDAIAPAGASVVRTKVGDVYVAEEAAKPETVFGGEPSGAWIWPDETLCPDGPLAACKLAALVGTDGALSKQVASIETYPLRRASIEVDGKGAVMERVAAAVTDRYDEVETIDGVRAETDTGWILIRASGTQPLIRVTAEARERADADDLFAEAKALVAGAR